MFSHLRKMNRKSRVYIVAEAFCLSLVSKDLKRCFLLKFECTFHSTKTTYYNWLVVWKHLLFSLGKMIPIWRAYFSNGLVPPPTRTSWKWSHVLFSPWEFPMDSDGPKGPRFGGALDDAARMFCEALDLQLSPETFVQKLGVEMSRSCISCIPWRIHGINSIFTYM